ncbi:ribosome 60S biogenesis N-terminal-domain-containing protein [Dichomitus squalens]|uniref:Ribosome 60S biogenesis N-terminal-domain-containing protein n=1 Tax=Dichomitus squalens TaxID=114155 RepID=A0A4Q9QEF4_9APHY|nr:ribosome 60S biogenesis N-terminal-domain-containing protein [Dichomitus squalens]
MPVRDHLPHKKRKVETSSPQSYKYASATEIRRVFKAQSESGLIEGLTALRNQLTVKPNEGPIQVNDERLLLAKSWLEEDPGAQELLTAWEGANTRQMSLLSVIVGVLSALLNLLSPHYTYHVHAQPLLRALLSQQWIHNLNTYLSGQHTELVLVTLKLFNSMSNFAGGRERKLVLDAFAWEMKSLPKLLHMRRKSKGAEDVDMLERPDIRTLYILFVLSFLETTTPASVKAAFLEQHRDAFTSVFKGLWQDSYSVIRRVLEVCWSGLWADAKLKRTLKIHVFSEATLSQLIRIYERNVPEGQDPESVPADVVHHFLLALCTRPGVGLCFHDHGWYPRETDPDQRVTTDIDERADDDMRQKGGKIHNKILSNVLKTLKVNEDPRQQELALKILAACPELVAGYWSSAGLALDPRLSSKWLANIAFFGAVVSLPIPTASFFLPESGSGSTSLYQPTPPPLSTIIENILPTAQIKTHLSRGLQASSSLVQHASALALAKCLLKYEQVLCAFQEVERALEENEEEGLWARRRREVEREVRRRVPDFQVIVGFSQRTNEASVPPPPADGQGKEEKQKEIVPNPTRTALLAESAHRLLWLYHQSLPAVVAEARFDAGKLLQAIEDMLAQGSSASPTGGLDTLRQLHVLRLLKESEHFTWSGKSGSKHSNFHILLKAYIITPVRVIRTAIVALLRHILAPGVLFQHDADEIALWLDSLPLTRRAAAAQAPDGAPLTDEGDSVLRFLDDCVQRCVKTPYKYVEELQTLYASSRSSSGEASSIGQRPDAFPSPLLATVVEQLGAKLRGKLLSPSDALALFSFVRKLLLRIVGKTADLALPQAFAAKIAELVEDDIYLEYPTMKDAIDREVALLVSSMGQLHNPIAAPSQSTSPAVLAFLEQVERLPDPESDAARQVAAYELVDWLRLIGPELHVSELSRLISAVEKFHKPALKELFQYLDPQSVAFWEGADVISNSARVVHAASFETLFLHCRNELLDNEACRTVLVSSLFTGHVEVVTVKRSVRLVLHRLSSPTIGAATMRDLLLILGSIINGLQNTGRIVDARIAALFCFESDAVKALTTRSLQDETREGLGRLLEAAFTVSGADIIQLFSTMTSRWVLTLRESLENMDQQQRTTALLWFKYMGAQEALALLDYLAERAEHSSSVAIQDIIKAVLEITSNTLSLELDVVTNALPLLCRLQSLLPKSSHLTSLIATGTRGSIPFGHDGYLPNRSFSDWSIASLIPSASKRWALRVRPAPPLSVSSVLAGAPLSDSDIHIATHLLYRSSSVRPAISEWLASPASKNCSSTHLVRLIFAFYDSARQEGFKADAARSHFSHLVKVVAEARHPRQICEMAADCVVLIVVSSPSDRSKYLKSLSKTFLSLNVDTLSPYPLAVGIGLLSEIGREAIPLTEELLDSGLKWAVRRFAEKASSTDDDQVKLSRIGSIIRAKVPLKSHLVEPVIAAIIQDRLASVDAVQFARLLASSTHLKPATVNRFLQTTVQHGRFYQYGAIASSGSNSARDSIVEFSHTLFHLHPNNTCQPSHIEPLRRLYGGSLGAADLKILSIFQLFESTRRTSIASLLSQWSATSDVDSGNALEALLSLEPSRVLRTCLEFPDWRTLASGVTECSSANDSLYDPVFILLLLSQTEEAPNSALAWVEFFRTNVVSLVIRTLSAKDARIREIAWGQVASLYKALEAADLQEKPHVLHIFNLLKDLHPSVPTEKVPRIPAFTTLLLAHAFRGIFYPSNFIYPLTARFLLQRPMLDPTDVPMLYGMLYSSSDEWKKERAWIVRFLSDGIVSSEEWRIMKRRHTWDLLASLFQSEERDRMLRRGVLEVLVNVTCNARATTSLILRHALLAWIEMQLQTMRGEEAIAWARILENILAVVDAGKMEAATNGEWRAVLGRCLRTVFRHPACTQGVFIVAFPVLLRLSLLPGSSLSHSPTLLRQSLSFLEVMEADVAVPTSGTLAPPLVPEDGVTSMSLHRSQQLFDSPPAVSIELWGDCVEALWRVSMALPNRTAEWDGLSSRLLIWRSISGAERTRVGEWARIETLTNLAVEA